MLKPTGITEADADALLAHLGAALDALQRLDEMSLRVESAAVPLDAAIGAKMTREISEAITPVSRAYRRALRVRRHFEAAAAFDERAALHAYADGGEWYETSDAERERLTAAGLVERTTKPLAPGYATADGARETVAWTLTDKGRARVAALDAVIGGAS